MPFDKAKARSRVNGARTAYSRGIHSQFINDLANDLEEALKLTDEAALTAQRALNDTARIGRELDDEKTAYRKLREQSAHSESMVALLREIAASPKGAQKKAAELLKSAGFAEPVIEPPPTVVN